MRGDFLGGGAGAKRRLVRQGDEPGRQLPNWYVIAPGLQGQTFDALCTRSTMTAIPCGWRIIPMRCGTAAC